MLPQDKALNFTALYIDLQGGLFMKQVQIIEISLLFALCAALCTGLWAQKQQRRLSSELVRLHVVANSDSDDDQAAKLQARDAILAVLAPKLSGLRDPAEAEAVIQKELPAIQLAAQQSLRKSGKFYPASAKLRWERFPQRDYSGFSLPAGDYVSLRVTLGEARGHNWWCVVFPPLCTAAAEDEDAFSELPPEDAALIRCEGGEPCVRFRVVELCGRLRQALEN